MVFLTPRRAIAQNFTFILYSFADKRLKSVIFMPKPYVYGLFVLYLLLVSSTY